MRRRRRRRSPASGRGGFSGGPGQAQLVQAGDVWAVTKAVEGFGGFAGMPDSLRAGARGAADTVSDLGAQAGRGAFDHVAEL